MAIQAQLYSWQDLIESSSEFNQLSFYPQQQHQYHSQIQQQQLQNLYLKNNQNLINFVSKQKSKAAQTLLISQNLASQVDTQRFEVGPSIGLQYERLRLALEEHRKKHLASMLRKYETETLLLMKLKDEEITSAVNKKMRLEDILKIMEMENQTWQRKAKEKEAMVMSLNNAIEQVKKSTTPKKVAEDAESCCDVVAMVENMDDEENKERAYGKQQRRNIMCKSCSCRCSCMILLPCRHLCSCKTCVPFLHSCPVCGMVKKAVIQVLI